MEIVDKDVYDDNWASSLAKILKKSEPNEQIGNVIGNVVGVSPLVISILDGNVLINSEIHQVYVASHLMGDYGREMSGSGNINFSDSNCGVTSSEHDGGHNASSHSHTIKALNVDTNFTMKGSISHTNGIEKGDVVLVLTDIDEDVFYVTSKLIKVGV